jgi:zinc resistance-associated protein
VEFFIGKEESYMIRKLFLRSCFILILLTVLGLGLMTADSAWAGPRGQGGCGGGGANLTPEQAGQIFDLRQQFMTDTAPLRRQMMEKRAELAALQNSQTPDSNQISAKQKELWDLRQQMQAKAAAFREEAGKIAPVGFGPGMGKGMGPGGGKGRGYCW